MPTPPLTKVQRVTAMVAIRRGLTKHLPDDRLRQAVCAVLGHPPVVRVCFGQVTCARCGDILGDTLAGSYRMDDKVIAGGHLQGCAECQARLADLPEEQRLLLEDLG